MVGESFFGSAVKVLEEVDDFASFFYLKTILGLGVNKLFDSGPSKRTNDSQGGCVIWTICNSSCSSIFQFL